MAMLIGTIFKLGLKLRYKFATAHGSPLLQQEETLSKLLKQSAKTQFGQHYGFEKIQQQASLIADFQQRVPIVDYQTMFERWWKKALAGEENVSWTGKIKHFALSSGTTGGSSKFIPVSDELIKSMRRTSLRVFGCNDALKMASNFFEGDFLFIGSCTQLKPYSAQSDILIGDVSGINTGKIPKWFDHFYRPGKAITDLPDWEQRLAAMVKNAPSWDIKLITGIPSWVQMVLEEIIKTYKLENIAQIWPNLQAYASGGIAFAPYKARFDKLIGKQIIYLDTYYSSEGSLAAQTDFKNPLMPLELMLNNGIFFEFVPFNDENFPNGEISPQAQALTIDKVELNVTYALLISTCAGAWRYLIGDTVKFVSLSPPQVLITGRTKQFLSLTGEHISVENMNAAITATETRFGVDILEFTVKGLQKADNHFAHVWFLGLKMPVDTEKSGEIIAFIDDFLQANNDDYRTERRHNLLKTVEGTIIPASIFYDFQKSQGKMGGQVKFPRVMNDAQYQLWLDFLQKNNIL